MHISQRPSIIVIFGITGDLAQRKLLPALYRVLRDGLLPCATHIIGVTRQDVTVADVLGKVQKQAEHNAAQNIEPCDRQALRTLADMTELFHMDMTAAEDYTQLLARLHELEGQYPHANRLYYLSIPPQAFLPVVRHLGQQGHGRPLREGSGAVRLLIEKPFGSDAASAQELITEVGQYFSEQQLYRIDHYLAKESAQNILTFRFSNPLFEAIWDNQHIEKIEITATETLGIEGRATFYEQTGALRDLVQSHLLQLLALTTMERPTSLTSDDIHIAKLELLETIEPIAADGVSAQTIRGQYQNYRDEVSNPKSIIETFAALRLYIHNKRWLGVPMILKTGKALATKTTEIAVYFKPDGAGKTNKLIFRLQPNEGITLELQAKQPGFSEQTAPVDMQFNYATAFADRQPDAYERVLVDVLRGDQTLFATSHEVITSWNIIHEVALAWSKNDGGLNMYSVGGLGPDISSIL